MCRYFAFSYVKDTADKSDKSVAWKQLFWSFRALEAGCWPHVGPDGNIDDGAVGSPLAVDGDKFYTAVLLYCKGDLEFMSNEVGIPHWGSELCCGLCWADKSRRNFKDPRWCANWRIYRITQAIVCTLDPGPDGPRCETFWGEKRASGKWFRQCGFSLC